MFTLTKENKDEFQKQVNKIGSKDESKVINSIAKEIEFLEKKVAEKPSHKIQNLISNAKLLYEIILEEKFPLSESSKKWIIFGLGYLVSDVDLIPDAIPGIGYLDDAMIISWVISVIDNDITRYEFYKKAKSFKNKGKVLRELVQGNGEQLVNILPGFIENKLDEIDDISSTKTIRSISGLTSTPGISILNWNLAYLHEFEKTIPLIDHQLSLKPIFDIEMFGIDWQHLKIDMKHIGTGLYREIEEIKESNPEKEIIIIASNVGSIIALKAIKLLDSESVSKLYLFGGTSSEEILQTSAVTKVYKIFNFYSNQDHALQFIFDNNELGHKPIGMGELHILTNANIRNIDVSKYISRHYDYKYRLSEIINHFEK